MRGREKIKTTEGKLKRRRVEWKRGAERYREVERKAVTEVDRVR